MTKKPIEPNKKIFIEKYISFNEISYSCNKISLDYFLSWIKENVPFDATDVTLSLNEEYSDYDGNLIGCHIQIGYKILIDNPRHEKEMEKYRKKMVKWKNQQTK